MRGRYFRLTQVAAILCYTSLARAAIREISLNGLASAVRRRRPSTAMPGHDGGEGASFTPTPTTRARYPCCDPFPAAVPPVARQTPARNSGTNPRRASPSCETACRGRWRGLRPIPCGSCAGTSVRARRSMVCLQSRGRSPDQPTGPAFGRPDDKLRDIRERGPAYRCTQSGYDACYCASALAQERGRNDERSEEMQRRTATA
jgi:hypothetical protein